MEYEDRIICFIDILGFKDIINSTIDKSGKSDTDKINILEDAFSKVRYFLDIENPNEFSKSKIVTQFSDCIAISFKYSEESEVFYTLIDIQHLLINLVYLGILCRGAIVFGKIIHTEKMIFGPGFNDAYILESKAANYPRIILDEDVLIVAANYHARHHTPKHELASLKSILGKDSDGMYYIDYFGSAQNELDDPAYDFHGYLEKLREIILNGLKSKKPDIKLKYNWLKQKYNNVINRFKAMDTPPEDVEFELWEAYHSLPLID